MTLEEFVEQRERLLCRECQRPTLQLDRNPNNGGVRPVCTACGSVSPLPGVSWLKQHPTKTPPRRVHDTREVWSLNGDHCAFCGFTWAMCDEFKIGRTVQHVVPFYKGGDEWPLIPFCARCQQSSAAELAKTRLIVDRNTALHEIIARIERNNPELREP